ncbi:MAG: response regulator transcription factor [Anaerolineales bacterium]|nr:response regulator transcription factor [Anaerolineales bacterium]
MKKTQEKIKIGILEDHIATAMGLKAQLDLNPRISVVWMAQYYQQVEEFLQDQPTNVLILDIGLPYSPNDPEPYPIFHAIPELLRAYPEIKVLVVSMHSRPALFKAVKDTGANGYILKHDGESFNRLDEILLDIYENDSIYYSPEVLKVLTTPNQLPSLTNRQAQILSLVRSQPGISNVELANILVVAPSTIRNHLSDIYIKLGVNNRASAIIKAQQLGLLPGDVENLQLD